MENKQETSLQVSLPQKHTQPRLLLFLLLFVQHFMEYFTTCSLAFSEQLVLFPSQSFLSSFFLPSLLFYFILHKYSLCFFPCSSLYFSLFFLFLFLGTFFSELALVEDVSSEYSYIASTDTECFSLSRCTFNDIIGSKKQRFIQQAYTGEIDMMFCVVWYDVVWCGVV